MPNPDEAPSHEGDVDDVGRVHDSHRPRINLGASMMREPPPKATAGYLDPPKPVGVRTRTRTVMRSAFVSDDRAAYFRSDTEELCPIALAWASWVDMGRPDRITVTIEPGDKLN